MDNNSKSLDEAIKAAQNSAKRGQTRFWILSLSWVIVIVIFSFFFIDLLRNFDRTQSELDSLATKLENQERRFLVRDSVLSYLESTFAELEFHQYTKLETDERKDKAKEIAERQLQRYYVSKGEQHFLNSEIQVSADQENAEDLYLQGIFKYNSPNYQKSIDIINRAIELDPNLKAAYYVRGKAYYSLTEYNEAIENFTKAIELGLTSSATYASRAFSYFKLSYVKKDNNLNKALKDCNRAIEIDSLYWVSHNYRGFVYYRMGKKQFDNAEVSWRKAEKLRIGLSGKAGSLENLGLIYLSNGEWSKALENCKDVNNLYNRKSWNWLFLHIAASKLGMKDLSDEAWKKWTSLKKDDDRKSLKMYLPKNLHNYLKQDF